MHTLDGPAWTLFFEYIANILYALGIRKLPIKALAVLVFLCAIFLAQLAITSPHGDVIGGWSLDPHQLHIGFARLLYPFFAGILLMRLGKRIHIPHAFALCSALILIVLAMPRIGGHAHVWMNGIYDSFAIIVLFPLIVAIGAGDGAGGRPPSKLAKHLGDLSYPLYVTHYPWIYLYTSWLARKHPTPATGAIAGAALFLIAIAIAWACLKLYDEPVRAWLTRKLSANVA
jgi:peptidoglycan/LPS O-acetylase OafA/YrhL